MQTAILLVVILLLSILIWRSRESPKDMVKECMIELLRKIQRHPDIKAEAVAGILKAYGFDAQSAPTVTRLVKSRLHRLGIPKEDHMAVLHEVSRSKLFLSQGDIHDTIETNQHSGAGGRLDLESQRFSERTQSTSSRARKQSHDKITESH